MNILDMASDLMELILVLGESKMYSHFDTSCCKNYTPNSYQTFVCFISMHFTYFSISLESFLLSGVILRSASSNWLRINQECAVQSDTDFDTKHCFSFLFLFAANIYVLSTYFVSLHEAKPHGKCHSDCSKVNYIESSKSLS